VSDQLVRCDVDGGVCTITLADVERRNVLSRRLVAELTDALDAAEADEGVRVIVLTNDGRVFCAGADLGEASGSGDGRDDGRDDSAPQSDLPAARPQDLFARFARSPKPYVGRIAGHCVAGGMGLAAAMDIAIATDDATMGFTEVRVGVAPAMISVLCLPRMRPADAADAFLRGRRFPASEAASMGLINRAVPAPELDAAVAEVVDDLLAGAPGAIAATKQLLYRVPTMIAGGDAETGLDDTFTWTAELSGRLFAGDEAKEGMAAFREKRPPSWMPSEQAGTVAERNVEG
jgi:methylglutaconyl-CoA hydratase